MNRRWPCDHCSLSTQYSSEVPAVGDKSEYERSLHCAVQNKELRLLYQPTLDLVLGRITSVEALLRWNHSSRGEQLPVDFLDCAERSGAIVPIGAWVLDQALSQFAQWQDMGLGIAGVSVNVSVTQLRSPSFMKMVQGALRRYRQEPHRLTLDVRESCAMCGCSVTTRLMARLATLGVRLSLNDFGAGYSSLCRFKRLPLSEMKIEGELIADIESDLQSMRLVSAMVALGKSVGLRVVAGGVETMGQQALLAEFGCDAIQGHHIGRPSFPHEIEQLVHRLAGRQRSIESYLQD